MACCIRRLLTRLLKTHNISHVSHINSTLQLKTGPPLRCQSWLVFAHHELCLLLIWVDIFAAQKDALEQVDMILDDELAIMSFQESLNQNNLSYLSLVVLAGVSLNNRKGSEP